MRIARNSPVYLGAILLWSVLCSWSVCGVTATMNRVTSNNISSELGDRQANPLPTSRWREDMNYGTVDRFPNVETSPNQTEAQHVPDKADDEEVYGEDEEEVVSEHPEQVKMKIGWNRKQWDSTRKRRSSKYDYNSNRGGQTAEEGARIRRPDLNKRGG